MNDKNFIEELKQKRDINDTIEMYRIDHLKVYKLKL